MRFNNFKQDKGVAGLTILLSVVTMLFVIGLLVMIFALMGGEIAESEGVFNSESASNTLNSTGFNSSTAVTFTDCNGATEGVITSLAVVNDTSGHTMAVTTDYTFTGCTVSGVTTSVYNNSLANYTYTYTFAGTSWDVVNDTTGSISNVTDWYDIFIVITAMVVLILLTVIIITAIRGSGLMGVGGGTTSAGGRNVGSA